MKQHGTLIDENTVRFERLLPGPIERVWAYLVESDKRASWLCGGKTELEIGGTVDMEFRHKGLAGQGGTASDPKPDKYRDMPDCVSFSGTVTECDPPNVLAHSWTFDGEHSEVRYELTEKVDRVLLVLTHSRLPAGDQLLSASAGWHTHLDILVAVLEGTEAPLFWEAHTAHEADYAQRLRPVT